MPRARREVRPVVPLGSPDTPDAVPGRLPREGRQTRALPDLLERFPQFRRRRHLQHQRTQPGQLLGRVLVRRRHKSVHLLAEGAVAVLFERFFTNAEGQGDGFGQVNPVGQPAAQPIQVVRFAAHDLGRELLLRHHPGREGGRRQS